ncbi:hypothetical protein SAMN05216553_101730 [Lentzea fradiae]|uniref:Uncharacterized protein n=1 Tax=Lentzea fradiae TaxID=200378 RepID=A0A1G7L8E6_9PSEU|nr:hypothetical protein [Lentzea fradiae]SDF45812.1 hypothetical protein SAMN05216553_101730 [Lentzea fradiae]
MSRLQAAIAITLVVVLSLLAAGGDAVRPGPLTENVARPGLLPPPPPERLEPSYREAVYGDFVLAGNSVLRCPVEGEEPGSHSPEQCRAATAGNAGSGGAFEDGSANNSGYYLHHADVDGVADTFNSSRATVTIPAGAKVRHARLNWGGHTGRFIGFSGVNCVQPLALQGERPPQPAAAEPRDQAVRLAVGQGRPAVVPLDPAHFRTTDGLTEPTQIYTNWADVTDFFGGVAGGTPVSVTVGNVWVPTGPGCAGGWSLTVVFGHDGPTPAHPRPRVVDIYSEDLPRGGALLPGLLEPLLPGVPPILDGLLPGLVPGLTGTDVVLPGVTRNKAGADVTIGVTAFDGDWRQGGESLTVDGAAVVEPCSSDGTADFFRSCALGAEDPLGPGPSPVNNLSVDAKVFAPPLSDGDSGDVEVGMNSVGDFVVVHSLVMSAAVEPSVSITLTGPSEPVKEGSLVSFTAEITNDGSLPLTEVALTLDGGARCTPGRFPALAPGQAVAATCVRTTPGSAAFTTKATVTASYLTGTSGKVTASAEVTTDVVASAYVVERLPDRFVVRQGATVEFAVRLANNSDEDLTEVVYQDDLVAGCAAPAAVLPARSEAEFTCVATAPEATFQSGGVMTAVTASGQRLTVSSDRVTVSVIAPAVAVAVSLRDDVVYRGTEVELTFSVTNTGTGDEEALTDVAVTAEGLCSPEPIAQLLPGETAEAGCVADAVRSQDVVAKALATDVSGEEVAGESPPVPLTVLEPLITLTQVSDRPVVRNGAEVGITFTVEHTGTAEDGPVTDVRIASPTLPADCLPEVVPSLDPGDTAEASCRATPDRSFDNQAFAGATDATGRAMTVGTTPLRVVVINPALTISTSVTPETAKRGARVDFSVVVRNIGDVPMTVRVRNDNAADCDFGLTGSGLPAGAAHGVRCTVTLPDGDTGDELTNTASFEAAPLPEVGDSGEPLTGADDATVTLEAGQAPAPPPPGTDPGEAPPPGGVGNGTIGAPGNTGTGRSSGTSRDGLASTGASIWLPIALGVGLLLAGGAALLVTSRRRHEPGTVLYRWWPESRR